MASLSIAVASSRPRTGPCSAATLDDKAPDRATRLAGGGGGGGEPGALIPGPGSPGGGAAGKGR